MSEREAKADLNHEDQLDPLFWSYEDLDAGSITIRKEKYKPYSTHLTTALEGAYSVCDDPENNLISSCVAFLPSCEYTGLHYHHVVILQVRDGVVASKKSHLLCHPSRDAFLAAKVSYFARIGLPVIVHPDILNPPKCFSDEATCRYWRTSWLWQAWVTEKHLRLARRAEYLKLEYHH